MKSIILASLISSAFSASIGHVEKRQGMGGMMGGMMGGGMGSDSLNIGGFDLTNIVNMDPAAMVAAGSMASKFLSKQKASKIETIPSVVRKDSTRVRITYGPYKLRGQGSEEANKKIGNFKSLDPAGTAFLYMTDSDFPSDVTILDVASKAVNSKFVKIDRNEGLYNHHNVFVDMNQPAPVFIGCSESGKSATLPINVVMGGAADASANLFTSINGEVNSGYYFPKDSSMMMMIDMVNYQNQTQEVYTVSEVEYLKGKQDGYLQSAIAPLDFGMCSGKSGTEVHAPKDRSKFTVGGQDLIVKNPGYFLYFRGHMHDGGENVEVKVNNKTVCVSEAQYGGEGHEGVTNGQKWTSINGMSTCETPVKVQKGDKLSIQAHFDMGLHPARKQVTGGMAEAMALLVTSFASE